MKDAFITLVHDQNIIEIKTPYDDVFVQQFKNKIPKNMRVWDRERRVWKVFNLYYLTDIKELCRYHYDNTIVKDIYPTENHSDIFNELFKIIEYSHRDEVYKALAKILHPDKGGNTRAMQIVNEIFKK